MNSCNYGCSVEGYIAEFGSCLSVGALLPLFQTLIMEVLFAGEAKDLLRKAREAKKADTLPVL